MGRALQKGDRLPRSPSAELDDGYFDCLQLCFE